MTYDEIMALPFTIDHYGHAIVSLKGHALAAKTGAVRRNRLVMWECVGEFDRALVVHHKNEIKHDDRPENLEIKKFGEHSAHHALGNTYGTANKGRILTQQHRDALSASRIGRKFPKHSEALKGRRLSEEHKNNIAASMTGKPHPHSMKCRVCGRPGSSAKGHAKHMVKWAPYPDEQVA